MTSSVEARIVLRDYARITACTANKYGGGMYSALSTITLAGDAVISQCLTLLPNTGMGGGIYGDNGTLVEMRDRAKVVECQAQVAGGCIFAASIVIADRAHVGHCTAQVLFGSPGTGTGGCLVASSRIVMNDFATLTNCFAGASSAFLLVLPGKIHLSGNAVVSDCTAVLHGAIVWGRFNTSVVLQDNATITRAYSEFYGNFLLQGDSSLLMTGRASIHDCVARLGSGIYANQSSIAIHGQNKIINCSGTAYCQPASSRLHNTVEKHLVGYLLSTERR